MPDLTFPRLHIRPERGWLNDPNGVSLVDGVYHVFFQLNPGAATHGDIHWGHARSTDLLTWTDQPIALAPRPGGIDAAGCWSGCLVEDNGVPTAVYTAVPDHAGHAGVALARSDRDLVAWTQTEAFVVGTPADPAIDEVRDPFVFTHDGHRYAVQGAGARHGRPQLLLYGCDDLERWTGLGPLLTDDDPIAAEFAGDANIWECPNLARIDDRWVLLVSLWRWRDENHELAGVRYLIGDLVPAGAGLRFVAESGGTLDEGPAFYAPQLLAGPDRTLLWGWAWELRSDAEVETAGWAGVLTFPRELFVAGGTLGSRPAAELTGLRGEPMVLGPDGVVDAQAFEVVAGGPVRLSLGEVVVVDAAGTATDPVRILVDGSIVETFAAGTAHTTRAYPTATDRWVVEGSAAVYSLGLAGSRPARG